MAWLLAELQWKCRAWSIGVFGGDVTGEPPGVVLMTEQGVFARFRSKTVMSFHRPRHGTKRVVVGAPLNDAVFDDIRTAVDEAEKSYQERTSERRRDTIDPVRWKIDLLQWLLARKTHIINRVRRRNTVTITNLPGKDA